MDYNIPSTINCQIILSHSRDVREIAFHGYHSARLFPVSGHLLLVEHVVDGGTSFDTEMYSPARFGSVDTDAFLSSPIMHSEMGLTRH